MKKALLFMIPMCVLLIVAALRYTGWPVPLRHEYVRTDGVTIERGGKRLYLAGFGFAWGWHGAYQAESNGVITLSGYYRNNKRVNEWRVFRKNGKLQMIQDYGEVGGSIIRTIYLNEDGSIKNVSEYSE